MPGSADDATAALYYLPTPVPAYLPHFRREDRRNQLNTEDRDLARDLHRRGMKNSYPSSTNS